jgi:hypothetical protein
MAIAAAARTVLLAPWWVASVATGAQSFVDNPVLGSAALNRRGLHAWRVATAARMTEWRRGRLAAALSPGDAAAFARDGFVLKRDFLAPEAFAALRAEVEGLVTTAREMVQGDTITRRIALGDRLLARLPATRAVVESAAWRELLAHVAGHRARPSQFIQTILSGVRPAEPDPQTVLHSDAFHPTMKAWLFLRDVPADEGPFTYVPGSHVMTKRRLVWERRMSVAAAQGLDRLSRRGSLRITADQLPRLRLPAPVAFAVPANTLVVADTHGFHARGPSLRPSIRVELWAMERRNPFLPWTGLDLWAIPGLRGRREAVQWRVLDLMERLGLGRNPWRRLPPRRPGDPAGPPEEHA